MSSIKLPEEQKKQLIDKIQRYFSEELDQELGSFDAEFLLDFFSENFGGVYYNQGLQDAQTVMMSKLEDISDALYEIEKPTNF